MQRRLLALCVGTALVLAACGGGNDGSLGEEDPATTGAGASADGSSGTVESDPGSGGAAAGSAEATLVVGDRTFTWTADQMTSCEIDGIFPASADFGVPPSQGGTGPWVQFIDRGDGGINFSAVLDGEEYSGTSSGSADEIRSDGFTYTGSMSRGGESVEVSLEVSC